MDVPCSDSNTPQLPQLTVAVSARCGGAVLGGHADPGALTTRVASAVGMSSQNSPTAGMPGIDEGRVGIARSVGTK